MTHEAEVKKFEEIPEHYFCCDFQREAARKRSGTRLLVDPSISSVSEVVCLACGTTQRVRGILILAMNKKLKQTGFSEDDHVRGSFIVADYLHIDEKPQ
jgi:hypothetical protein